MNNLAYKPEPMLNADQLIARLNTDLMLIKLQSNNLMVMLDGRNKDFRDSEIRRADEVDEQAVAVRAKEKS